MCMFPLSSSAYGSLVLDKDAVESYVDHAVAALGLALDAEYRSGVVANFERTAAIAELVMLFELPDTVEAAPVFRP
jgi:hypothetical protein